MNTQRYLPGLFTLGIFAVAATLMIFPAYRVAGVIAVIAGIGAWVTKAIVDRRNPS